MSSFAWAAVVMAAVGVLWVGGVGGQEPCTPPTPDQNDDHSIPDYKDTLAGSYTLVVEMTSIKQNLTYYVKEERERRVYHDYLSDTAAVSVVNNDSTTVYHFYPLQGRFNTQYGDRCISSGEQPGFLPWGWYDVDPTHGDDNYGPSSLLRLASYMNTEFVGGDEVLEGVEVEQWRTCTEDGKAEIKYYFSERPWSMPFANWFLEGDGRVPVRIHVGLTDNSMAWQYNIVQFLPFVASQSNLETPRGLACENLVSVMSDVKIPDIPWHFSLAEEIVKNSEIEGNIYGTQHLDKLQMTYAGKLSLVSLTYLPMDDTSPVSQYELELIHDFNTGVQYTVNREYGNCSLGFIPSFSFDSHYAGFIGSGGLLLSPNDLFHIDDSYAFLGEEASRSIEGDRFTSTRLDIPDPDTNGVFNYKKAVLEYYFSQGQEVTPTGSVPVNLPLRADLFVYNSSNLLQVVSASTTNFYDFQEINLYSEEEFSVQECYEQNDDRWSYIVLFFPATKEKQFELVKDEVKRFKHELISQLVNLGNMSPVRIADIQVEDGVSGVIPNTTNADMITVSVRLLERAPYIYTYRTPLGEEYQNPGSKEKSIDDIEALEDCAALCSQEETFTCKSFHHCDNQVCFLSATENTDGNEINSYDLCRHWIFNLTNKTFQDYPTQKVYSEILAAIKNRKFSFSILYKEEQVDFEASASLHYRTPDPEDLIKAQFTIEVSSATIAHPDDVIQNVTAMDECLNLCVSWKAFRCQTLVHMRLEGQCLLIARDFAVINRTELVPHSQAFIYSRSYLVDYKPVLGGVALTTSGPVYTNVDHIETCAMYCSTEKNIKCLSFEWCYDSLECHLHSEHFLDVSGGGNYLLNTSCIHFSSKTDNIFTRYGNQGMPSTKHKLALVNSDASSCAKLCTDDPEEVCQSFDFCSECHQDDYGVCGQDNEGANNLCFIGTHHLGERGLKLITATHCAHYSRDLFGDLDYASWLAEQQKNDKVYTPGDMTWLAFGMIFLGALLTMGFLVLMVIYKPASVPKDLSVSFVTLKTQGISDV